MILPSPGTTTSLRCDKRRLRSAIRQRLFQRSRHNRCRLWVAADGRHRRRRGRRQQRARLIGHVDVVAFARFGDGIGDVGRDDQGMHFPGFHVEATQMLLERSSAAAIATDTLSLDFGMSADFATHYAWLPAGRYGIENLAGLDKVPAAGATLVVGAPNHVGGTGGPARIFAMV